MRLLLFFFYFLCNCYIHGQTVKLPTFKSFEPIDIKPSRQSFLGQYSIERQQQLLQQESEQKEEQLRRFRAVQEGEKRLVKSHNNSIEQEKEYFNQSALDLEKLLKNRSMAVTHKAVFAVEKAFLGNQLSNEKLNKEIEYLANFLKRYALSKRWSWEDYNTRQKTLMLLFTDTMAIGGEMQLPLKYDHKDPYGLVDYSNLFVSKLLQTKRGQCHSLPLLYKILADRIRVTAYLCLMPQHSYIRFTDDQGKWYNFETTCGKIVPTAWLVASGFVSSEAIRKKTYMDTLGYSAIVTNAFADLLEGYVRKFGYDEFVLKWSTTALQYNPKDIRCLQWQSNYLTIQTQKLIQKANFPPRNELPKYPEIWEYYQHVMKIYEKIDALGHTEVPNSVYQKWLQTTQ